MLVEWVMDLKDYSLKRSYGVEKETCLFKKRVGYVHY